MPSSIPTDCSSRLFQHVLTSAEYSRLPDLRRLMLNFLQLGEWERPKDGGPNKVFLTPRRHGVTHSKWQQAVSAAPITFRPALVVSLLY